MQTYRLSPNTSERHAVHPDAILSKVQRHTFGHRHYRSLTGRVCPTIRLGTVSTVATNVHNRAVFTYDVKY
jgi:hypothetical protein